MIQSLPRPRPSVDAPHPRRQLPKMPMMPSSSRHLPLPQPSLQPRRHLHPRPPMPLPRRRMPNLLARARTRARHRLPPRLTMAKILRRRRDPGPSPRTNRSVLSARTISFSGTKERSYCKIHHLHQMEKLPAPEPTAHRVISPKVPPVVPTPLPVSQPSDVIARRMERSASPSWLSASPPSGRPSTPTPASPTRRRPRSRRPTIASSSKSGRSSI
mmetsp:Transcript_21109/g.49820  ORF Transcript_21109/g.49820 Transcript_21109/m.49820 type:complete len:215 (+) Transcript_21109:415-1059(+)